MQWLRDFLDRRLHQRGLFRYHDGRRWRHGDPFLIWRRLHNHPKCNLETMAPELDEGKEPGATIVLDAICQVFDVQRWDDHGKSGLIDWELIGLLAQLDAFLDDLKKNTSPGPISSEPTESESSISPAPPDEVTSSSSDSGSVPIESSAD